VPSQGSTWCSLCAPCSRPRGGGSDSGASRSRRPIPRRHTWRRRDLGDLSKATFNNVESLQRVFIVQTLGFFLSHIEANLAAWCEVEEEEYFEFDVEGAMLRPDFKERMEAFKAAVQGGIYTPNEVRLAEHLSAQEGGDKIYLQSQMRPVSALAVAPVTGSGLGAGGPGSDEEPAEPRELTMRLAARLAHLNADRRRRLTHVA
jgi:hypothetical protein